MTWTTDEWEGFCALVEEAWPGTFDDRQAKSWRFLLEPLTLQQAGDALRRLMLEGHRFRPSASEFLAAARHDPGQPTFAEAYQLIFGRRGAIYARPSQAVWATEGAMRSAKREAILDRARLMHPLVASFVERQGVDRLQSLRLEDPEWGDKIRRDLEHDWDRHVEAMDGRQVAALASGRGELAQLDPLAVLGLKPPTELPEGAA